MTSAAPIDTLKNKMAEIPQSRKHCGLLKETEINMLICDVIQTMQVVLNTAVERTAVPGTAVMENVP